MADYKDLPHGRKEQVLYHDEGDGSFSKAAAAHLRGWDTTDLAWTRLPVDHATGALKVVATVSGGTGGTVDQGTGGSSAWKVDGSAVTQPVSGTFWQSTQPVSIASMPSTPVTGPLTDTQLRATPVPVSLATAPTTAVTQSTSPWVTNDPGLPDTLGQKAMSGSTGVTIASDQTSFPVAATLTAETTKVIGTVNQGTSPWVTSRNWTLSSGTDSVTVGNATMPSTPVTNVGTFAVQAAATQSGSWVLSGSDNVSTLPVSARVHNGFTHLYVRDQGVIAVLTELLFEIQQLNFTQENN